MNRLKDAIDQGHVILDLDATDLTTAIERSVHRMVVNGFLSEQTEVPLVAAFLQREQTAPTTIGHATAIPHAYLDEIEQPMVVFVRLSHPVNLGAPDGIPTQFLFFCWDRPIRPRNISILSPTSPGSCPMTSFATKRLKLIPTTIF